MNLLRVDNMYSAFVETNLLFTTRSSLYVDVHHNSFRNDHFLNIFNTLIEADSQVTNLSLEEIGYSNRKITHLLKSYLIPEVYQEWLAKIEDTTMKFGKVDSDISMSTSGNSKHGNGPCLLAFSFRSHVVPELTVFSRSVELPQTFGADTILVAAMASDIADRIGTTTPIRVKWYIASARIKSRAANFFRLFAYPKVGEVIYENPEFHKHVDKQWMNILANQDKEVSFSKLVKLQQEYKRVVIDNDSPENCTRYQDFQVKLRGTWNV